MLYWRYELETIVIFIGGEYSPVAVIAQFSESLGRSEGKYY